MATIPGGQFRLTAHETVNAVETRTGTGLQGAVGGYFNVEVFVGLAANAPTTAAHGCNGLAVLSPSGHELDLVSGKFAATDNGGGHDTISAFGSGETVSGGAALVSLNLYGAHDTVNGGSGNDTINVYGAHDTVNAVHGVVRAVNIDRVVPAAAVHGVVRAVKVQRDQRGAARNRLTAAESADRVVAAAVIGGGELAADQIELVAARAEHGKAVEAVSRGRRRVCRQTDKNLDIEVAAYGPLQTRSGPRLDGVDRLVRG